MSVGLGMRRRIAAAGIVAGTAVAARAADPPGLDARLGAALSRSRGRVADRVSGAVTDAGSVYGLVGTSVVMLGAGRRRGAARVAVAGGAAWVVAQGAKELVRRQRPYELGIAERLVQPPAGSSWPSGHSAVAAALSTAAAADLRPIGQAAMVGVATTVAATRVQLGVHHPSDVVAGVALGALVADVAVAAVEGVADRLPAWWARRAGDLSGWWPCAGRPRRWRPRR